MIILNKIMSNLFVGNIFSLNQQSLKTNRITHIISLVELPNHILKMLEEINVQPFIHTFSDSPDVDIIDHCQTLYPKIFELTNNPNNIVLINCSAGRSRSVAVVIYYLMKSTDRSFVSIYEYVKSLHPFTELNRGFYCKLHQLNTLLES